MLFFLFSDEELRGCSRGSATTTTRTLARQNDRLLRPAHLARLDAEFRHPRRGARRPRPGELMGAVPGRAGERHRRRPGRHDQGGHPHGRHVRDARPAAAQLRRHATSATASCTSIPGCSTGSTGSSFSMQFRGTPIRVSIAGHELTVHAHARGLPRAGPHRRRRRGSRARRGRQLRVQPVPTIRASRAEPRRATRKRPAVAAAFDVPSSTSTARSSTDVPGLPGVEYWMITYPSTRTTADQLYASLASYTS